MEISFASILGPQKMARYCLRNYMLEAVIRMMLVPKMDNSFLPRLTPCKFDLECQLHEETHSLVQSNSLKCSASLLYLYNMYWAPCCCWTYMLLTKLHHYPFLRLNLCKCFMYFLQSLPMYLSSVAKIPLHWPLVAPIWFLTDLLLLSTSSHGHDFHWK